MSGHYSTSSYSREWKAPAWASQSDRAVSFPQGDDELGARLGTINWGSESLVKFNKNFYKEHEDVSARSDAEVKRIRDEVGITIHGAAVPKPVLTFAESNFPDYIQKTLIDAKFVKPTSIQSQGKRKRRMATRAQWKRHDRDRTDRIGEDVGLYPSGNNTHQRPGKA